MGKFDGILKNLGREDAASPEQILSEMENQEQMENLNDFSNVPDENFANVERLINGSAFGPAGTEDAASSGTAVNAEGISQDILGELSALDGPLPNIDEIQSHMQLTHYDQPMEEEEIPSAPEAFQSEAQPEENAPSDIFEPQFRTMPKFEPEENSPAEETFPGMAPESDASLSDLFSELSGGETPAAGETLPEFNFEETAEIPAAEGMPGAGTAAEAPSMEMPDFNFDLGETSPSAEAPSSEASFELPDLSGFESPTSGPTPEFNMEEPGMELGNLETPDFGEIGLPEAEKGETELHEFSDIQDQIPSFNAPKDTIRPDILKGQGGSFSTNVGMDLDPDKAVKIRNRINKIQNPLLRKKVREAFLNPHIPGDVTAQLSTMLLLGEDEPALEQFLKNTISDAAIERQEKEIREAATRTRENEPVRRKVVYTQETRKAQEFQQEFSHFSKIIFGIIAGSIIFGAVFMFTVWIPMVSDRAYVKGFKALEMQDSRSAEEYFTQGRKRGGPKLKWYNRYALEYIKQKDWTSAKKKFVEALEYNPLDEETIFNFAKYYKTVYPPRHDEAVKLYERLMKKKPSEFSYLDKTAFTLVEWGDITTDTDLQTKLYVQANDLYEHYLSLDRKGRFLPAYFRLLDIALRMKNESRIDTLYDTIDHINKKAVNFQTFTDLGRYYIDARRLDRAKKVFDKLMPFHPDQKKREEVLLASDSWYEYARLLTLNMDYKRAIRAVEQSTNFNTNNGRAYNLLGEIFNINDSLPNNKVTALELFQTASRISPAYYKPYANMGHIYFYNNLNFQNPADAFSRAFENYKYAAAYITSDTKDDMLSYNLGWLYYEYKDYDAALESFARLYVDEPANPVLSYDLANIYYQKGMYELARAEYDKAIEYYQAIADKIGYINPGLERHREIFTQLSRSYNNRGLVFTQLAKRGRRQDNEQKALLDFYRAKDSANKIDMIYEFAEVNIKTMLNRAMKNRPWAFDSKLPMRTSLKKLLDEFREKMISTI